MRPIADIIASMDRRQLIKLSWEDAPYDVILEALIDYEDQNDDLDTEYLRGELKEVYRE